MTDITSALWRFWGQFALNGAPVPVYQAGAVPADAAFPFLTFTAPVGDAFTTLQVSATLWTRYDGDDSATAIAQRMAMGDAVSAAIPPLVGVRIPLPVGFLMLYRGSGDFLASMDDPDDARVLGLRIGCEATYYTT